MGGSKISVLYQYDDANANARTENSRGQRIERVVYSGNGVSSGQLEAELQMVTCDFTMPRAAPPELILIASLALGDAGERVGHHWADYKCHNFYKKTRRGKTTGSSSDNYT